MKRPQNMLGRQFESSGPEGKFRGNALQLYERYKTAAREVQPSDRILAESFSQFADHYYRLAAEYGAFDNDNALRRDDSFMGDGEPGNEQNEQEENAGEAAPDDGDGGAPEGEQPSILAGEDGGSRSQRHRARNSFDGPRRDEEGQRRNGQRRDGDGAGERHAMNGHPEPETQPPVVLKQTLGEKVKEPASDAPASRPLTPTVPSVPVEEIHAPAFLQVEAPRRKRGRPRKEEAAVTTEVAPKLDLGEPEPAAPAEAAKAEETPAPRRRGRPRKNPIAAEPAKEPV